MLGEALSPRAVVSGQPDLRKKGLRGPIGQLLAENPGVVTNVNWECGMLQEVGKDWELL